MAELQLDDCVACHVGEQMWFEYHVHASWMVCERNFSRDPRRRFDPLAHLHLVAPQEEAVVDLSCAECARDAEVEPEAQGGDRRGRGREGGCGAGLLCFEIASFLVLLRCRL